jgi:hypothetical protein
VGEAKDRARALVRVFEVTIRGEEPRRVLAKSAAAGQV